jgi:hypothetical protein
VLHQVLEHSAAPEQEWPSGYKQFPLEQVAPAGQACPQRPQFAVLLDNVAQTPLHPVWPTAQQVLLEQFPFAH